MLSTENTAVFPLCWYVYDKLSIKVRDLGSCIIDK